MIQVICILLVAFSLHRYIQAETAHWKRMRHIRAEVGRAIANWRRTPSGFSRRLAK